MARPTKFQKATKTRYFDDVTPLWVPPGQPPIKACYHDAIDALVDWVGASWADNETTGFFPMRSILVKSCDNWAMYDWQSDIERIVERRADAKYLPKLDRAFEKFALAFGKAPFRRERRLFSLAFLAEFCPNLPRGLSNEEGLAAVDRVSRASPEI